ncbi:MAG: Tm-1-like ATP-binding domain-containing protein [Deltaproteobacteria bacterium]|nr:Tm-1-like ATP-binding domain-containing protein [Deltaproteobacteria bacterium]
MKKVYIVGTCDTKYPELKYVQELITAAGVPTVLVDVGILAHSNPVDVTNKEVAAAHPVKPDFLANIKDRGEAVITMSEALEMFLPGRTDLGGIISMGGSGGTSLATRGMRSLPIGTPKLMVSTVASGDVAPYVGPNDICMMYSVADIAGLNPITRAVLGNAAHAIAGMVAWPIPEVKESRPLLGVTMFGVTTPCVDQLRKILGEDYEPLVFHATGTGGQSLEKLIDSGMVKHVIDATTTEICDLLMGGVFSAGEDRLGSIIRTQIPYVGSVGALDMVNFGAKETVPPQFRDRKLHVHNANVTLMRTTAEENRRMGLWIAAKLNQCQGPVRFLLPEKGVSMIDAPGMPFHDPEADAALFAALEEALIQTDRRRLIKLPYHINDPGFSKALADNFKEITIH